MKCQYIPVHEMDEGGQPDNHDAGLFAQCSIPSMCRAIFALVLAWTGEFVVSNLRDYTQNFHPKIEVKFVIQVYANEEG